MFLGKSPALFRCRGRSIRRHCCVLYVRSDKCPFKTELGIYESIGIIIFSSAIISLIMFFGGPPTAVFIGRSVEWLESRVVRMPLQDIAVGSWGLIIGLIIS